ncbi:uncharacterized protein LOC128886763 [Hylaeus anthracinus]|uniref:uncharacterized protein LOC128886763 n=1 Tax=Hylaeus anthracinus TaxID=313031 RepID=UPI0023B8E48C|nr:uncharacterized protein LOC128886763 [Hylaeus anthracinus]
MNDYKIACCDTIAILCVDKIGRSAFLKAPGPRKLYNLLVDVKSIPVRNAAVQLIQSLCADPSLADAFVQARYLNFMVNNRTTAIGVPTWDTCIEALFDSHLPIKFAFTGRLSLHDVTQNGFYVLHPVQMSIEDLTRTGIFMSSELQNLVMDSKFGRLQCDSCLYDYVELFKCKLVAAESKCVTSKVRQGLANVNYVASRAKMLAKFVARKMSGPDPLIGCVDHQLEIHLKEIKATIETSIIPLGMLRVGSYLERALLFKVIADRIHLPAALVRGEYGKTWVEVAVPQVEGPVEETSFKPYLDRDTSCPEFVTLQTIPPYSCKDSDKDAVSIDNRQTVFPTKLMKPNFIVDLMDSPGDLIPINCHRARFYYETQRVCDKLCRD